MSARAAPLALLLLLVLWSGCARAGSGCPDAHSGGADTNAPAGPGGPGLIAYIDPDTGQLAARRPPGVRPPGITRPQAPEAPMTEHVLPDGSVRLDVGRHFVTQLRAEIVDGRLVTCHAPGAPDTGPVAGDGEGEAAGD